MRVFRKRSVKYVPESELATAVGAPAAPVWKADEDF
jgi:hypothetical protein